jgi:hypothetical protein
MVEHGQNSSALERVQIAGFFEQGNKHSGIKKFGEFLD